MHCLLVAFGCATNELYSQCVKPTPMTGQQIGMATGTWKENYAYNGAQQVVDIAYVFQSTSENGRIKGLFSFYTDDNKRTIGGHFVLDRE